MTLGANIGISSITGALNMIITNPLDTYRLRWQVLPVADRGSAVDFIKAIGRQEGFINGLWRPAIATNAVLCSCTVGIRIGAYPTIRDALINATGTGADNPTTMFAAGLLSGATGYFLGSPLYMIKNQLQSEAGMLVDGVYASGARKGLPPLYRHGAHGLHHVWHAEGIRGLWRGSGVLLVRGATLSSAQLMGYDATKAACKRNGMADGPALQTLASFVGAVIMTTAVMPVDVTLNRFHASATVGQRFTSPLQCVQAIVKAEGVAGLWRGWTAMFVRMLPSSVITFTLYEGIRKAAGYEYM